MSQVGNIVLTDNGEAADYVSIFKWDDGSDIVTYTPTLFGEWVYEPPFDITCGITYVHKRATPVTHGPYTFLGKFGETLDSGYLLMVYASSGGRYVKSYDKTAIDDINWQANFEQVMDIGLLHYKHGSGVVSITKVEKIIDVFLHSWTLAIYGGNGTWYNDAHTWTMELLDSNNSVLAAVKSEADGTFRSGLWYGTSLQSMTKAPQTASYPFTSGVLTFTSSSIKHVSDNQSTANHSFMFYVNISQAVKLRVTGNANSTYTSGGGAGGYIKIVKPII